MLTARAAAVAGRLLRRKAENPYPLREPIIMFWGFPTRVAALPMLEPVASAIRNGPGGSPDLLVADSTNGVMKTHTVSFTRNAERTAAEAQVVASRTPGDRPERVANPAMASKIPASSRKADRSIIPKRSMMVEASTAANDSSGVSTPAATMSTAPSSAPAGLPMGRKPSSLAAISM